jgi:hypothetical protein
MTSGYSVAVENALQDQALRGTPYPIAPGTMASMHTADPGATGANEVTNAGGSTYARQACTWGAAAGGVSNLAAPVDFPGMPPVTVNFFGVWTPGGVFVGGAPCSPRTLVLNDIYRLNTNTTLSMTRSP